MYKFSDIATAFGKRSDTPAVYIGDYLPPNGIFAPIINYSTVDEALGSINIATLKTKVGRMSVGNVTVQRTSPTVVVVNWTSQLCDFVRIDWGTGNTYVAAGANTATVSAPSGSSVTVSPMSSALRYSPIAAVIIASATIDIQQSGPTVNAAFSDVTLSNNTVTYSLGNYFNNATDYTVSSPYANATITSGVMSVVGALRETAYNVIVTASNAIGTVNSTLAVTESGLPKSYPPGPLTAANTTLAGYAYGNGTYTVNQSRQSSTRPAWQIADYGAGVWQSTIDGASSTVGDWVEIKLPAAIRLASFWINFMTNTIFGRGMPRFELQASQPGSSTMELIGTYSKPVTWNVPADITTYSVASPGNTVLYDRFRLVNLQNVSLLQMYEWRLIS